VFKEALLMPAVHAGMVSTYTAGGIVRGGALAVVGVEDVEWLALKAAAIAKEHIARSHNGDGRICWAIVACVLLSSGCDTACRH
jgi:hypothetical protein